MRGIETGQTVVRRDVHRSSRVWSEQALRVVADTGAGFVTACAPERRPAGPPCIAQAWRGTGPAPGLGSTPSTSPWTCWSRPTSPAGSGRTRTCAVRRCDSSGGERPAPLILSQQDGEAEGSPIRVMPGRAGAALTKTGRASTARWCGPANVTERST